MVLDHLVHGISSRERAQNMLTYHAAILDALAIARMEGRAFNAYFIGGGTYSLPRAWAATGARADITVAEIDPAVTEVAAEQFWFDPATARVLTEDARRALLTRPDARYDLIIGDAFTDIAVPPHLITQEFFQLVADRMTEDGLYLMNVIDHMDRLQALAAITRSLQTVFPVVEIWIDPDAHPSENRRSFILLAGHSPSAFAEIGARSSEGYRAARLPARLVEDVLTRAPGLILTDDYAPIDRLLGAGRADER